MKLKKTITSALAVLTIASAAIPAVSLIDHSTTLTANAATYIDVDAQPARIGCPDGTKRTCSYNGATFKFILSNKKVYIYGIATQNDYVVIPATIGGYPVVYIDAASMSGNKTVKKVSFNNTSKIRINADAFNTYGSTTKNGYKESIYIPNKQIKALVFNGPFEIVDVNDPNTAGENFESTSLVLPNVEKITFGKNITTIPDLSFNNMQNLKSVYASNVTKIEDMAFTDCINLQTLNTPKLKTIGYEAFYHCLNLPVSKMNELLKISGNINIFAYMNESNATDSNIIEKFSSGTIIRQKYKDNSIFIAAQTDTETMILAASQYDSSTKTLKKSDTAVSNYTIPKDINNKKVVYISHRALIDEFINTKKLKINTNKANIQDCDMTLDTLDLRGMTFDNNHTSFCGLYTKNVYLPDTAKTLPTYIFYNSNIENSLNLKNIETIQKYAFKGAHVYNSLIGHNVKTVNSYGFSGSTIFMIDIPNVTKIDTHAFDESCSTLIINDKVSCPPKLFDTHDGIEYRKHI